jgi:hypothetical protein
MESRYEYRVVHLALQAEAMERELNDWATAGFRVVSVVLLPSRPREADHVMAVGSVLAVVLERIVVPERPYP